jgi:hypothetical protein
MPSSTPTEQSRLVALCLGAALAACSPSATTEPPPGNHPTGAPRAATVEFQYLTLDGKPLDTRSVLGRTTVIGFATTYDLPSQAQARFLTGLLHRHKPRLNVALLVLEPPENQPLVEAFVRTLGLTYPVALADSATIAGQGPFAGLHHVPSVVVLDREGREAWRHVGLAEEEVIEDALRPIERAR